MKFVLASHNEKKLRELHARFSQIGIEVVPLPAEAPEPEETGESFEENAAIKARSAMQFTGLPAIADDSGLAVDALGGAPGVYSARYCAGTDCDRNALLLRNLENVAEEKRTARFVCALVCVFPNEAQEAITVRGECSGIILRAARGAGGFGYDPLFYVPAEHATFSELSAETKGRISHRGRAIDAMAAALHTRFTDDLSAIHDEGETILC